MNITTRRPDLKQRVILLFGSVGFSIQYLNIFLKTYLIALRHYANWRSDVVRVVAKKGDIMREKMPETEYRASRVCRILGNPTAYQVIKSLFKRAKMPTELARELGLSVQTISDVLAKLRNIDLVRYEVKSDKRIYWLKDVVIMNICRDLEKYVKRMRVHKS